MRSSARRCRSEGGNPRPSETSLIRLSLDPLRFGIVPAQRIFGIRRACGATRSKLRKGEDHFVVVSRCAIRLVRPEMNNVPQGGADALRLLRPIALSTRVFGAPAIPRLYCTD